MRRFASVGSGWLCWIVLAWLLIASGRADAQSFEWKAGAFGFFDNGEYSKMEDGVLSQTMFGIRFSPEVGLKYKDFGLFVGTHLLTSFGSPKYLDKVYFTGYFQYENPRHKFLFGAFPRQGLLDNYTNIYTGFFPVFPAQYDGAFLPVHGAFAVCEPMAGLDGRSLEDGA